MAKNYLVTCAISETPTCEDTLAVLEGYCEYNDAELIVIGSSYNNGRGKFSSFYDKGEYCHRISPYMRNRDIKLNDYLSIKATMSINPTSINPIAGINNMAGQTSLIIGHPHMQILHLPVPRGCFPKTIASTGTVSVPNYDQRPTGNKGEFYHMMGAKILRVSGRKFSQRELCIKYGVAYDLDKCYSANGKVTLNNRVSAIVHGDTHWGQHCLKLHNSTFGEGGLRELLNPHYQVFHDLFSGQTVNPHHVPISKSLGVGMTVQEELHGALRYAIENSTADCGIILPNSNHNAFLNRWILDDKVDWRRMSKDNAELYLELAQDLLKSRKHSSEGITYHDSFVEYVKYACEGHNNVHALELDEPFFIENYDVGSHGHIGVSGSRGSPNQFIGAPNKMITGHCHSGQRRAGHLAVGQSTGELDYTKGLSRATQTHVIIYPNDTASLITAVNSRFFI